MRSPSEAGDRSAMGRGETERGGADKGMPDSAPVDGKPHRHSRQVSAAAAARRRLG